MGGGTGTGVGEFPLKLSGIQVETIFAPDLVYGSRYTPAGDYTSVEKAKIKKPKRDVRLDFTLNCYEIRREIDVTLFEPKATRFLEKMEVQTPAQLENKELEVYLQQRKFMGFPLPQKVIGFSKAFD